LSYAIDGAESSGPNDPLTEKIIGAVYRADHERGGCFLESIYQWIALGQAGLRVEIEVPVPVESSRNGRWSVSIWPGRGDTRSSGTEDPRFDQRGS
jgi:hypothetical protein